MVKQIPRQEFTYYLAEFSVCCSGETEEFQMHCAHCSHGWSVFFKMQLIASLSEKGTVCLILNYNAGVFLFFFF